MNGYIEKRPEAIAAIKKAIAEKWNLICMGCVDLEPECALCVYSGYPLCTRCPLEKANANCEEGNSTFRAWGVMAEVLCGDCEWEGLTRCREGECPIKHAPEEAEAMLEALVQLLPPADRIEFGG